MDQNSRHISSLKEILQLDVWEHRKRSEERGTLWGTSLPVAFDDHPKFPIIQCSRGESYLS